MNQVTVPKTSELKEYWNSFSKTYSNTLEPTTLRLQQNLVNAIGLKKYKSILEVGCGSGLFSMWAIQEVQEGTKYTSIDLADEMIKVAQERKSQFSGMLPKNVEHTFSVGNVEDLAGIPDESVDCYIAPLVLHLAENPDKMLAEAKRVLKKGGVFGCTVLGSPEESTFFKIVNDRYKEMNIELPKKRSIHHLGNREALMGIVEKSGLEVEFCWDEFMIKPLRNVDELQQVYDVPKNKKIMSGLDEETIKKLKENVEKAYFEFLKEKKPFKIQSLLLTAVKKE